MYNKLYISFIIIVLIFTILKLVIRGNGKEDALPTIFPLKTFLLGIVVIGFIAFFPADYGSDKERYLDLFLNIETKSFKKDIGWVYYNKIIQFIFNDSNVFFLITAMLYLYGNYVFIKKSVHKNYVFYIFLTTIGSLGFYAYGVNTIRSGIGLSLLLLAIINRKNWRFILFLFLSIIIHKSLIIPAFAFIITKFYSNTKRLLLIWVVFLITSIINIIDVSDFLKNTFADSDERIEVYIGVESSELYNAGFRVDFLIYSILPLLVGFYYIYKQNFKDLFYMRLFNMYIIVNCFWLLLIRIPFTDRFAYLSWFLIPFIALYPLFYIPNIKKRNIKLAFTMSIIVLLNFILIFK